ncbi:MAG: ATP-grasp domain-containing protein [Phycisphaerae bacterium]
MAERVHILLTCIGRRVSLLEAFRRTLASLGVEGRVFGADWSALAPAFHVADEGFIVPGVNAPEYADTLLDLCRRQEVDLVVPLLDWELCTLADARDRFEAAGVRVVVSSPEVTRICWDKQRACRFLSEQGVATPRLLSFEEAAAGPFPVIAKDRYGSASKRVRQLHSASAVKRIGRRRRRLVFQEYVEGREYTVDVYTGLDGRPRVAVPRWRIQVRAGEVSKGMTIRHAEVIRRSMHLAEVLGGCRGVVTCQCRVDADGAVKFFDVNPRFGGGVPLAIRAGADFPKWLIQEHLGLEPEIDPDAWEAGLVMLRYDEAVFCRAEEAGLDEDGREVEA